MATAISYIDENGVLQEITEYTVVTADDTTWSSGYYVVNADVSISHGVTVSGDVKLILQDGVTLTVDASSATDVAGITVQNAVGTSTNQFFVYGQSASTGTLTVTGSENSAGIGANWNGGNNSQIGSYITISGGTVNASSALGTGIGGRRSGAASHITITGGVVNATGNDKSAAIGAGKWASASDITISGGVVNATSSSNGAGIGGGDSGNVTNVTISGNATVTATSVGGAGIGSGKGGAASSGITVSTDQKLLAGSSAKNAVELDHATGTDIASSLSGKLYVSVTPPPAEVSFIDENGDTQVIGGSSEGKLASTYTLISSSDAAVTWTAGYYVVGADYDGNGVINAADAALGQNTFTISGGATVSGDVKLILADGFSLTVDASTTAGLAGITVQNSSLTSTTNQLAIYGQTASSGIVNVLGGTNAAGIGGNKWQIGSNITLAGGTVNATGGFRATAIGGGDCSHSANIKITGGIVNATAGTNAAAIGGGASGGRGTGITISGGTVNANSASTGAAIGGGYNGTGENITISGGVVNATSTSGGAAIGSGNDNKTTVFSNITISGGVVNATASFGAGIGGGRGAAGGSGITISGGTVTATSTNADALGNGYGGSGAANISVNTDLSLVAGASAAAATEIAHTTGTDLTSSLAGQKYAAVTPPLAEVSFIDENGDTQVIGGSSEGKLASNYTLISSSSAAVTWTAGYYVVGADYDGNGVINAADAALGQNTFTITGGAVVSGNVKLILADGFSLTVDASATANAAGICVQNAANASTNQLFVYAQSAGSGVLDAIAGENGAGIGSTYNSGKIGSYVTISGGTVTATGNGRGAGIGGSSNGEHITITGGVVTANGGATGAAGIGGGPSGSGKNITISGGTVNAYGIGNGAGIGGAWNGSGENITISGGVVTASSTGNGAGIGAGTYSSNNPGKNITISGGTVTAISVSGAGIGGGKSGYATNVTISGDAIVTATSGNGDGIGNGQSGSGSSQIYVSTGRLVAGSSAATATDVAHGATTDSATALAGNKYAAALQALPEVSFIDENGDTQVVGGTSEARLADLYVCVTSSESAVTWGTAGETTYYVLNSDCTISGGVTVLGDVRLILSDGCSLTVDSTGTSAAGISVRNTTASPDGNLFYVYGQTASTGTLTATGGTDAAGIGGMQGCIGSHITISGGTVNANAGISDKGAEGGGSAIGGGRSAVGEYITITGGVVNATALGQSAAIGGGRFATGSNITISGGTVNASSNSGAGIGGGNSAAGSNITISGGTVNASSVTGAGIGSGVSAAASDITISGGVVNVNSTSTGAGIGSGYKGTATNITISGGTVNASGSGRAACIGSGDTGSVSGITISGGVVNAVSTGTGAGIGGGIYSSASDITISGGIVNAVSNSNSAAIGSGYNTSFTGGTITGGVVNATGNGGGAAIGSGANDNGTSSASDITITGGIVNANGTNGAGIGGGNKGAAEDITITGGVVSASSGGSAIGSGKSNTGSTGVYVGVDYTVRGGTGTEKWDYVSEAGDHTESDDLADYLEGMHYASVCILSDGSEFTKSAYYGGTSTRIEGFTGGTGRMLIGGGVLSTSQEVTASYALSIGSGSFNDSVAGGYAANGSAVVEQTGDVALEIDGGTFDKRVAGGMYVATETSSATLTGDVNFTIKGGTFAGRIYGGCNSQQDSCGVNGTIDGSVSVTVDSSANAIYIGNYLIGGSRGAGAVTGDVTVTFTGLGSNLSFNGGTSVVAGGCNSDYVKVDAEGAKTTVTAVDGSRNLVFDDFDGNFGADIKLFSTATFKNNSEVTLTDSRINLWAIETWNFEAGSSLAGLRANDFAGDTINFDLTGWDETDWTVASGTVAGFDDLNLASAVYFGTSKATYDTENACWTDDTYKLALSSDQNAMIVSKIA